MSLSMNIMTLLGSRNPGLTAQTLMMVLPILAHAMKYAVPRPEHDNPYGIVTHIDFGEMAKAKRMESPSRGIPAHQPPPRDSAPPAFEDVVLELQTSEGNTRFQIKASHVRSKLSQEHRQQLAHEIQERPDQTQRKIARSVATHLAKNTDIHRKLFGKLKPCSRPCLATLGICCCISHISSMCGKKAEFETWVGKFLEEHPGFLKFLQCCCEEVEEQVKEQVEDAVEAIVVGNEESNCLASFFCKGWSCLKDCCSWMGDTISNCCEECGGSGDGGDFEGSCITMTIM